MAKPVRKKAAARKSPEPLELKIEVDTTEAKAAIEELKGMVKDLRAEIGSIAVDAVRKARRARRL